jgi:hypothetical protein
MAIIYNTTVTNNSYGGSLNIKTSQTPEFNYKNLPVLIRIPFEDIKYGIVIDKENSNTFSSYLDVITFDRNNGDIKREIISESYVIRDTNAYLCLCKVKIKSVYKSVKQFGYKRAKESMLFSTIEEINSMKGKNEQYEPSYFQITSYKENYICKRDGVARDILTVKKGEKNIKFLVEDCEIIYPNPNGYKLKLDKTIKIGDIVKNRLDNRLYHVIGWKKNNNSKIIFQSKYNVNRHLDVMTLEDIENRKQIKKYIKHLKKINDDVIIKAIKAKEVNLPF